VEKELPYLPFPQSIVLHPQVAIRESGVWLDVHAPNYACVLMLHVANENKRDDQAVKCVSAAGPDCATTTWDILCARLDGRSFARSLSLLDNLMLRQRPSQSLAEYVHFMRHAFDDYNETCEMIDGSITFHPHHLGLLMLRGISNNGPFGKANSTSLTPSTQTTSCMRTTKSWLAFSGVTCR
jgi:hypothetical protein